MDEDQMQLPKIEPGQELEAIVLLLAAILGQQCRGRTQTARLQQALLSMDVGINALTVVYNEKNKQEEEEGAGG